MTTILALPLGAVAILTTIPPITFVISIAAVLKRSNLSLSILAIVSSPFGMLALMSMVGLLYLRFQDRYGHSDHTLETRRNWQQILTAAAGLLCGLFAAVSLAAFVWMQIRSADLPRTILGFNTRALLTAAFVLWVISSIAQVTFLLVIFLESRGAAQQTQSLHTDEEPHRSSEMQQTFRLQTAKPPSRERESSDAPSISSRSRKRSGSDAMNSMRSSFTQVVRPMSSKTRLVSQKPYRPTSLDSGTGEREIIEDGFDSWDTSAVDPQSRQFVLSAGNSTNTSSPSGGRFLETIPASPTGSRSPSPGFPLDLEPPPRRRRSRSHSPATTIVDIRRRDTAPSPTSSEAHIHPLFRTDSPTPPPTATPGTIVTAAPGAGQVILDRQSLRCMRSSSLTSSPLVHSRSLDDMASTVQDDDESVRSPSPPEREMTPPIPDWILGAGPRNSLTGYTRRKGLVGLGPVGEAGES